MAASDNQLAAETGLSPETVETYRREHLAEGEHWARDGSKVVWLPAGKAALLEMIGTPPQTLTPVPTHMLPILQVPANRQWVVVRLPDGSRTNIRVRNNSRLQPRLLLRCQLSAKGWLCVQPGIAPG
jgi:hypothetical protein